jgi:chromosome segregation ATPase
MVNESSQQPTDGVDAIKQKSNQVDALQNQLGNILSGVEKSLAVTCESIMVKMKQLEDKIQDMEKKYTELAKDAEKSLKEADGIESASENGSKIAPATVDSAEPSTPKDDTSGAIDQHQS